MLPVTGADISAPRYGQRGWVYAHRNGGRYCATRAMNNIITDNSRALVTPVTMPVSEPTVATAVLLLLQVPSDDPVGSESVVGELPTHAIGEPVMVPATGAEHNGVITTTPLPVVL